MKILFLGDVVAKIGRDAVIAKLPELKKQYDVDFTIVNGENSAHGKGITTKIYRALKNAGADVITLGNHAFSKNMILTQLDECPDMVRPENLEPRNIGNSWIIKEVNGKKIAVVNLLGKVFMDIATDAPWTAMDRILTEILNQADMIIVDLHGEVTGEKEIFYHLFQSRVTAMLGTHTHVQTADEQVQNGCAFISDVGMCGSFESVLGRDLQEVIQRNVYGEATHYTPASTPAMVCGVVITVDDETNRATDIQRIQIRPE